MLKCIWNLKRPQITTAILRKKNRVGGIARPDIRLYYKPTLVKTARPRHETRHTDQRDRTRSPETKPHTHAKRGKGRKIMGNGDTFLKIYIFIYSM